VEVDPHAAQEAQEEVSKSTYWFEGPLGVGVSVTVDTDAAVRVLDTMAASMADLRPVYAELANWMRRSFARNFFEGGRPERWKPLAESTLAAKAGNPRVTYSDPIRRRRVRRLAQLSSMGIPARSTSNILIANGDLRDSAAQKSKDHIERVNKDGLEIGSKHWLAEIHQFGTPPYTIRARSGRFLRFMTAGGFVFAKVVHHPGVPARPFIVAQEEDVEHAAEALATHVGGSD